jgi:hypothetical protein
VEEVKSKKEKEASPEDQMEAKCCKEQVSQGSALHQQERSSQSTKKTWSSMHFYILSEI